MKKIFLFLLCLSGLSAVSSAGQRDPEKVPVIHLKGTPYMRGVQHGRVLKSEIAAVYAKWKNNIRKDTGSDPDSVIADFLRTTDFTPAIRKWTPEILDEVRGIADGSGQTYPDVFAFQLIDEYWGYLDRKAHGAADGKEHCSAMGVAGRKDRPGYVAQNIDLDTWMHGYQVLLHIEGTPDTPEQYHMSCAGSLGLAGVNANRIGVVVNALTDLQNATDGLPVAYVLRGILSRRSQGEALGFLNQVRHASGQNYVVGIRDSVYDFEASANQVVRYMPLNKPEVVFHTNHALVNHDVKPWFREYHRQVLAGPVRKNSTLTRFDAVYSRYADAAELTVDLAKSTLRSKDSDKYPVCIAYNAEKAAFTFSSVVFTLGARPVVEVTMGSPDQSEYQKFQFKKVDNQ